MVAYPRFCPLRRRPGRGHERRDEPTPARFQAALDPDRDRTQGVVVILFPAKGPIIAAIAFQFASTNLVFELASSSPC